MKLRSLRHYSFVASLIVCAMFARVDAHPDHEDERTAEQVLASILPEMNFNAIAVGDALEFLGNVTKSDIAVDWEELKKAGVEKTTPLTLRVQNQKVSEMLDQMFQALAPSEPLAFKPDGKTIRISTEAKLKK